MKDEQTDRDDTKRQAEKPLTTRFQLFITRWFDFYFSLTEFSFHSKFKISHMQLIIISLYF